MTSTTTIETATEELQSLFPKRHITVSLSGCSDPSSRAPRFMAKVVIAALTVGSHKSTVEFSGTSLETCVSQAKHFHEREEN